MPRFAHFIPLFLCMIPHVAYPAPGRLRADLGKLNVRLETKHYRLAGTVSDDRLAEYGRCLEYIYDEYAKGFEGIVPERASSEGTKLGESGFESPKSIQDNDRFPVVIFATDAQYNDFGAAYLSGRTEHTRGVYVPAERLLLIRDEPDSAQTYEILFHEAFHQFMHRYVPLAPVWLNEGLATYYGTARVTAQGLMFDRPASWFFEVARNALSARKLIPLSELMKFRPVEFYSHQPIEGIASDRSLLAYSQSYTFVGFILTDPEGPRHLRRYLRDLASAKTDGDVGTVTDRHFPPELLDAMVPKWIAYVNRY